MRDVFVAALCVVGFLLVTYLAGQRNTWDFWLSLVGGVALVGVVFFPTGRPGLLPGAPRCGTAPMPEGCVPIQQALGEGLAATIHFTFALIFIVSLAFIAFVFAYREKTHRNNNRMALVQRACGWVIIAAVVGVALTEPFHVSLGELTPLYIGEVVAIWAFGISWLLKGKDLRRTLRLKR